MAPRRIKRATRIVTAFFLIFGTNRVVEVLTAFSERTVGVAEYTDGPSRLGKERRNLAISFSINGREPADLSPNRLG